MIIRQSEEMMDSRLNESKKMKVIRRVKHMKINSINRVANLYKTNQVTRAKKVETVKGRDEVQLSGMAKDFQYAKEVGKKASDVRIDKVNEIKSRMQSGTYNVKGQEVARKLMESGFDFKA